MSKADEVISNYLESAKALLQSGLEQMQSENPTQLQDVAEAARAGAAFTIHTGLSTMGLFEVRISIVGASGQTVDLLRIESGVVNQ